MRPNEMMFICKPLYASPEICVGNFFTSSQTAPDSNFLEHNLILSTITAIENAFLATICNLSQDTSTKFSLLLL